MKSDKYSPLVSIIVVDYKRKNPYLIECLNAIQKQTYKNYEILLICDYKVENLKYPKLRQKYYGSYVGPAEKRDEGGRLAKGDILAFLDDDAYPSGAWLEHLVPHFKNESIAGVGGPGVTPPYISWEEEASGWASASPAGAGPYTYRFLPGKRQFVDDYPSMNLAVRKTDFKKVSGYDSNYWPGEDTKLCLDLTHYLGKRIIYEPKAIVYHHRRPILFAHLRQNGNFGLHRGVFARILPKTSLKLVYFLPSLIFLGFIYMIITSPLPLYASTSVETINVTEPFTIYQPIIIAKPVINALLVIRNLGIYCFILYFLTLSLNALWVLKKSKKPLHALLSILIIFITHLWYGFRFTQGFLFTGKLVR